jgi:hypothetical protein
VRSLFGFSYAIPAHGDDWRTIAQRLHMVPAVKAKDTRHILAYLVAN